MKFTLTLATAILAGSLLAQNNLTSIPYQVVKSNATLENSPIPSYIEFDANNRPLIQDFSKVFSGYFKRDANFSFVEIGRENDQLGFVHIRYEQTYKGNGIELAEVIAHTKNGEIHSINGKLIADAPLSSTKSLDESSALQAALNHIGALSYKWQLQDEENHLKIETKDLQATYFPTGELKYISNELDLNPSELKLAYKFNIYAHNPMSRQEIYIDATSGDVLFSNSLIHTVNSKGTATTAYSGVQTINTDSLSPTSFRLRQTVSGGGVYTFDLQRGTNYANAADFTDTDNNWNNVNTNLDQYATDAHWGAEMTYDFLFTNYNRNSINNAGFALNSYVHANLVGFGLGSNANAFWDGQRMTYGDGNFNISPLVALDVAGHEIIHGLTTFSADLIYASESGALNESFSDIFGTAIEFFARPNRANWTIGEDIGSAFRSMSNPNTFGDPDTYGEPTFWRNVVGCTPSQANDQCGVHSNSGVQNFWFYVLTNGRTGTNGVGNAYSVTGIGITKAAAIAYRNLTTYLTQSSDYADARFYSIQSAIDLYGNCSPEVIAVTNAWHAVGVGNSYTPGITSTFTSDFTSNCVVPFTVEFENTSNNGSSFFWDFGDGTTSTQRNPTHTYTTLGQYDVKMVADGGACGIDSTTTANYIDIDTNNSCVVILQNGMNTTQLECSGKLFDTGGRTGNYGRNENAVITIAPVGAASVSLNFVSFDVEPGTGGACNFDFLEIFDGASTNATSLGVYCDNNIPTVVNSTTGAITLRFISDNFTEDTGFEIDWTCQLPTTAPTANFSISSPTSCTGEIEFTDISTQAPSSWAWDFGDGTSSTLENPIHNYTVNGTYDVTLVASNSFGVDTVTQTNVVTITRPAAPALSADTACLGQSVTLSGNATGTLSWYTTEFGGSPIATGNSVTINNLMADSTLWTESLEVAPIQVVGPVTNTIGTGRNFTGNQYLEFDVLEKIELVSVRVYAGSSGNRTIELRDNNGTVLQSLTRFVSAGAFRVNLNFVIEPGTDYQLGTAASAGGPDLYRNNGGVSYPYSIANKLTIQRSSAGTNPVGFYYFFYNWRVKSLDCLSPRAAVTAIADTSCSVTTSLSSNSLDEEGIRVYPNPASSQFVIDFSTLSNIERIQIRDLTGKLVYLKSNTFTEQTSNVDVSDWSDGVYFIQVESANTSIVKKMIVNHK